MEIKLDQREPSVGDIIAYKGGEEWTTRPLPRRHPMPPAHTIERVQVVMSRWQSPDFESGVSGWRIDSDGSAQFNSVTARGTIYATAGEIGGWSISADEITCDSGAVGMSSLASGATDWRFWAGNATPGSAPFRVDEDGNLYATTGTIGGWTIATNDLSADSGNLVLDASIPAIRMGGATGYLTGTGIYMGKDAGTYKVHFGDPSGDHLKWDGSDLTITGYFIGSTDMGGTVAQTFEINEDDDAGTTSLILNSGGTTSSLDWDGTSLIFSDGIKVPGGSVSTPSLAFTDDPDTGFWHTGSGHIAMTINGSTLVHFYGTYVEYEKEMRMKNDTPIRMNDNALNTRRVLLIDGSNIVRIGAVDSGWGSTTIIGAGTAMQFWANKASSSVLAMEIDTGGNVHGKVAFRAANGSKALPGYAFTSDWDSGFFRYSDGVIAFSSNNTDVVHFSGDGLIPASTDTYDLGSSTKLWRKGWLSELESVLFVENTVQVTGGWQMVPHQAGTLEEDVDDSETAIDFGSAALVVNDFILLRGNLQVEYMQITSEVGGGVWNVTRNVDGSGANSWPQGHVWVNLGYDGDGRIEFDAQTGGPRISVFTQGTSYNTQDELVRIGDLNGWGPYSSTTYGIGLGDHSGGEYLKWDATNGLVISGTITAGAGEIGGWTVTADTFASGAVEINSSTPAIMLGATSYTTGDGVWMGDNGGMYKARFGGVGSDPRFIWNGVFVRIYATGSSWTNFNSHGISILTNYKAVLELQDDGDLFIGTDTSAPADTYFSIFSNAQTYNSESMAAGDMLIGDNSSGKANILWDKSEGQLKFRGGTSTELWLDTDGTLTCASGVVTMDSEGMYINSSGDADAYMKWTNPDVTTYPDMAAYLNLQKTDADSNPYGTFNYGIKHDSNNQCYFTVGLEYASLYMQVSGSWREVASWGMDEQTYVTGSGWIKFREPSGSTGNPSLSVKVRDNQYDYALGLFADDVNHGFTGLFPSTDCFGGLRKLESGEGGLYIYGAAGGTPEYALFLDAVVNDETDIDTGNAANLDGVMVFRVGQRSGTSGTAISDSKNAFVWKNWDSTRMILHGQGNLQLDGTVSASAWDDHDDIALLDTARHLTAGVALQERTQEWIEDNKGILEATGVLTYNNPDDIWISAQGMMFLTVDAVRQVNAKVEALRNENEQLRAQIAQLRTLLPDLTKL